jgi:hypothetical protein
MIAGLNINEIEKLHLSKKFISSAADKSAPRNGHFYSKMKRLR